jgi:hypothetical protein
MTHRSPNLPPPWPPQSDDGHSIKEVEHRFTNLEAFSQESRADRERMHKTISRHGEKLTLHERILLGLLIAFATLVQDRLPYLAAFLKALTGS